MECPIYLNTRVDCKSQKKSQQIYIKTSRGLNSKAKCTNLIDEDIATRPLFYSWKIYQIENVPDIW